MIIRAICFFASLLLSLSAMATLYPRPLHILVATGSELRPEKDVENNYATHALSNVALGVGYKDFAFILEKASFRESSGNSTLNVERLLEDTMLWAQWQAQAWHIFAPYVGGGLGAYQETVTINLAGAQSSQHQSNRKLLTGANFGVRVDVPVYWISLEGRLLFGDELDHQPALGGLARFGLWF